MSKENEIHVVEIDGVEYVTLEEFRSVMATVFELCRATATMIGIPYTKQASQGYTRKTV